MKSQTQLFLPPPHQAAFAPFSSRAFRDCKNPQNGFFWGRRLKQNPALRLLTRLCRIQPQAASASPLRGSPVPASSGRHISSGFFHLGRFAEGHGGQQPQLSHAAFAGRCWEGTGWSQYWESSAQASSGFINSWPTLQACKVAPYLSLQRVCKVLAALQICLGVFYSNLRLPDSHI